MEETSVDNFEKIVEAVKNSQCILFLGAGVHYPPGDDSPYAGTYPKEHQPPLGDGLAQILAADSGIGTDRDLNSKQRSAIEGSLQRIALYHEMKMQRSSMVDKVREAVSNNKRPSRAVRALAALDFPVICTTNYDKLFEHALILADKQPVVSSYRSDKSQTTTDYPGLIPDPREPFLVKIHGDIDDPMSVVITDEDYIHFVIRMMTGKMDYDPIPGALRYCVKRLPILFVGFSLMDYDLRLLFKVLSWDWDLKLARKAYSVGPYPDPLIRKKYDPPVQFIVRDMWTFIPALYRAVTGKDMP